MGLVIKAVLLAAAGVAGWVLAKRKTAKEAPEGTEKVVYLGEDDAIIDPERPPVPAAVKNCYRRMDPLSLNSGNEAVFLLEGGTEIKLSFSG